jgi:hypothetical protein
MTVTSEHPARGVTRFRTVVDGVDADVELPFLPDLIGILGDADTPLTRRSSRRGPLPERPQWSLGPLTRLRLNGRRPRRPADRPDAGRPVSGWARSPRIHRDTEPPDRRTGQAGKDRGSGTALGLMLLLIVIALAATVIEVGNDMRTSATATDLAQEAARAGANQLDLAELRATGVVRIDPIAARTAALAYLSRLGATGTVLATPNTVTVTVTITRPAVLLPLVGVTSITVTSDATAQPVLS